MPRFPYYGFNYPYYNNYMPYHRRLSNISQNNCNIDSHTDSKNSNSSEDKTVNCNKENSKNANKSNNNLFSFGKEDYIFDLFGIKLYFDDILILSLLFFLYKEGVKDYGLFIALLLLLIS